MPVRVDQPGMTGIAMQIEHPCAGGNGARARLNSLDVVPWITTSHLQAASRRCINDPHGQTVTPDGCPGVALGCNER